MKWNPFKRKEKTIEEKLNTPVKPLDAATEKILLELDLLRRAYKTQIKNGYINIAMVTKSKIKALEFKLYGFTDDEETD